MSDGLSREMTLEEAANYWGTTHAAAKELRALIAERDALRAQLAERARQRDDLSARVKQLEHGYDELRTVCNRQQHQLAAARRVPDDAALDALVTSIRTASNDKALDISTAWSLLAVADDAITALRRQLAEAKAQSPQKLIDGFSRLEANWDSYGATPVSPVAIAAAKIIAAEIDSLQAFPSPNGEVEFESNNFLTCTISVSGEVEWDVSDSLRAAMRGDRDAG